MLHQKLFLNSGIFVLLCAFTLNLAAWGIQTFDALSETTVPDVAISMSRIIETCHHHPHGCPKDCMCPKTYLTVGDDEQGGQPASGIVREPALVTCTEHDSENLTSTFSVFLPESSLAIRIAGICLPHSLTREIISQSPLGEPPQKVPIV